MKKRMNVLTFLLAIVCLVSCCAFAQAEESAPQYSFSNVNYDGSAITGQLVHREGTGECEQLYVRVTVFLANGSYMTVVIPVDSDLSFEGGASGNFVYVGMVATGTMKCVNPGGWASYGRYAIEF